MRRIEWWETDEEHKAGKHYRLIVDSKEFLSGFLINGRLLGNDDIESIYMPQRKVRDEKAGIIDMVRDLFWRIKDMPDMLPLIRRMWALYLADYDSARETDITDDLASYCELLRDPSFAEVMSEDLYIHNINALDEAISSNEKASPEKVDPFFIPEAGPQMDLFR